MRILLVDLERAWRGGQSQALLLLRGLRERGHAAELVAPAGSALAERAAAAGITVHLTTGRDRRWGAAGVLRRLLREGRVDIVHANEAHALTAAWLARAHKRAPLVAARRVAYPFSRGYLSLARYRAARRIVAVSAFVARSVAGAGLPTDAIRVVYDGVEIRPLSTLDQRRRARERWGIPEHASLFGCVGYLLPEKGQEFLVRALPLIRERYADCQLLLAGGGPERGNLERLADQLGVRTAVHFAGHVADVDAVYDALDLFVFPSLAEPLGSSLLAAMAAGLAVVAVATGAVPEVIEPEVNGVSLSSPNPREIAAAVTRLLADPELARRLGRRAREVIAERFAADRMVGETLKIYSELRGSS